MKNMKLWDWVVWNQRLKWKIIEYFMPSKKFKGVENHQKDF